jgi:hypothetical protein
MKPQIAQTTIIVIHFHSDNTSKLAVHSCRTVEMSRILRKSIAQHAPIEHLCPLRCPSRRHKGKKGRQRGLHSHDFEAFRGLCHNRRCESCRSLRSVIIMSQMWTVCSPMSGHHTVPAEVILHWFGLQRCFFRLLAFGSVGNQLLSHPMAKVCPPFDQFLSQFIAHLI